MKSFRRALVPVFLTCAMLTGGGCDREAPPSAAVAAAPVQVHPVGPLPGLQRHVPRANPFSGDPRALLDGRRFFAAFNCAGCHGPHGGGGMGPSLRDTVWIYGGTDEDVFDSIAAGRARGMPAWGVMLPADVVWKLTAYVRSMRTSDEPQPPR